jgi:hypothetical protein
MFLCTLPIMTGSNFIQPTNEGDVEIRNALDNSVLDCIKKGSNYDCNLPSNGMFIVREYIDEYNICEYYITCTDGTCLVTEVELMELKLKERFTLPNQVVAPIFSYYTLLGQKIQDIRYYKGTYIEVDKFFNTQIKNKY